jgi:flagellar hook assembly protein FlgD
LEIFDIEGRQVRTVETPRLNGGYHRITWDGRNDEGLDVSPGTYFCRVSCGSWSATTKTQLLR